MWKSSVDHIYKHRSNIGLLPSVGDNWYRVNRTPWAMIHNHHGVVPELLLTEISEHQEFLSERIPVTIRKKREKTWQIVQFMHLFPNTQSLPMHLNIFSELYIYLSNMFKSVFTLKKVIFFLNNEKNVRSLNKLETKYAPHLIIMDKVVLLRVIF
jgi:hypothetical protein